MKTQGRFSFLQWTVLWALMGLVLLAAVPLGSDRPLSWTLLALAILVLFGLQVLLDSFQRLPEQVRGLWFPALLFLGAVVWGGVQVMQDVPDPYLHPVWADLDNVRGYISADPGQGRQVIMRYLCYAMIFWIAFRAAVVSTRAGAMLKTIAIALTAFAIFGVYPMVVPDTALHVVATGTFADGSSFATYAAFGFLANLAAYMHVTSGARIEDDRWENFLREMLERFFNGGWIYALGALLCLGALSLTSSRAGGAAGIVGLVVFLTAWMVKDRRWNVWLFVLLIVAVAVCLLTVNTGVFDAFLPPDLKTNRFPVYAQVIQGIMDRPVLGHGLGSFQDVFKQYVPAEAAAEDWARAHNTVLENAFELGIPAVSAFFLALTLVTWRVYRATLIRQRNRAFACFALAVIATAATHSLFDFSLQVPAIAALFAVILGMGWGQSLPLRDLALED